MFLLDTITLDVAPRRSLSSLGTPVDGEGSPWTPGPHLLLFSCSDQPMNDRVEPQDIVIARPAPAKKLTARLFEASHLRVIKQIKPFVPKPL